MFVKQGIISFMEEISQTLGIASFHSVPVAMTLHDITQKRGNYVITLAQLCVSASFCGGFRQESNPQNSAIASLHCVPVAMTNQPWVSPVELKELISLQVFTKNHWV